MAQPTLTLAFLLPIWFLLSQAVRSETISDRVDWPPVFERSYGDPKLLVFNAEGVEPKIQFIRPARLVTVRADDSCPEAQIDWTIRQYFLGLLWKDYLAQGALSENEIRLNMKELVPMPRATFLKIGHCHLAGRSTGNRVHDAWWRVRTGMDLKESCDHLLAITTLEWDDPDKYSHGHFAFALRKRGGDIHTDALYDFRAPWELDRRPRFTEAPNIHNKLKLKALRENLYDWIYTQTEFRNSHVTMSFVKVHEEQVALLRAYNGRVHEAGNFRVFKKNCASLGTQFINRLLPLDEEIKGEHSFADLPLRKNQHTIEQLGGLIKEVYIENRTLEAGREPTSRSKLHPAKPSRKLSRGYQILSAVDEVN
ncbi:MAG: hypothetical protein P1U89_04260 [Verrucomicrobiales bacterium]|nr:hypothetical protein [Verrucomicrobiales bacterium]